MLRRPALEDADAIYDRIASDPEVARFLLWIPHPDVAETRRVIMNQLLKNDKERNWVITLRNSGDVVGLISCRRPVAHSVELGYCLSRQWWDKGVMSEALNVLLAEWAKDPKVFRIWATCHVDNGRAARLLQRAGFALEGRLLRHAVYPTMGPEPRDSLLYAKVLR